MSAASRRGLHSGTSFNGELARRIAQSPTLKSVTLANDRAR
jgi:hypothetical protein